MRPSCTNCQDRKHIFDGKNWVLCTCQRESLVKRRLTAFGVVDELQNTTWDDLPSKFVAIKSILSTNSAVVFTGSRRHKVVVAILNERLQYGGEAAQLRMDDYIQSSFDDELRLNYSTVIKNIPFLWVRADFSRLHSYFESSLREIVERRVGKQTVFTCDSPSRFKKHLKVVSV